MVVFGLHFEYCVRLPNSNWAHNVHLSEVQSKRWKDILGAVSYFVDKMPDVQSLPDYVPFVKLKRMDYNKEEVGLAVPLY